MRIDVIETNADLDAARPDWERVYDSDPHARYFLSWRWMRSYLGSRKRWFVLALREKAEGSPYVAFLPLRLVTTRDARTGVFSDEIYMAGNHAADYTGLLCDPAYEAHAARGFGLFLKSQNWSHLHLDNFSGPRARCDALLATLDGPELSLRKTDRHDGAGIDHAVCPVATLPDSWQAYLDANLSSQTRQKLRRFLRQVESDSSYDISVAMAETIDRDLDALFALWRRKWGAIKGKQAEKIVGTSRQILLEAFHRGDLLLPVLRHGDRPIGALASFLDRRKGRVLFYIAGRDEDWKTPSPGLVLHAYSIRKAIADGFTRYDFLRGNEPYKYAYGVVDEPLHCITVSTRSGRNLHESLNLRSIAHVYDCGVKLYAAGDRKAAETAFEQVISACPDHLNARFGLAILMFDRGQLQEAENALASIAAKSSNAVPVLVRLGDAQLALEKFTDAAKTFAIVVSEKPDNVQAHFKLGTALAASDRKAEAVKAFRVLQRLRSDDPQLRAYRQKADLALARLTARRRPDLKLPAIHPSGFPLPSLGQVDLRGRNLLPPRLMAELRSWQDALGAVSDFPFARASGTDDFHPKTKH